jgi:alpha-acetolactate decarboxylase
MIVLDGRIYQVRGDGKARIVEDEVLIPFAAILPFTEEVKFNLKESTALLALKAACNEHRTSENLFLCHSCRRALSARSYSGHAACQGIYSFS